MPKDIELLLYLCQGQSDCVSRDKFPLCRLLKIGNCFFMLAQFFGELA